MKNVTAEEIEATMEAASRLIRGNPPSIFSHTPPPKITQPKADTRFSLEKEMERRRVQTGFRQHV